MLRFPQPPEPGDFADTVAAAKQHIERLQRSREPKAKDFADRWRKYKPVLLAAQQNKCGYCEQKLATHPADVEHYRPKAMLQELPADRTKWGCERKGAYNVDNRDLDKISSHGYWWLAYTWFNYLAACNRCNSGWKRNLFPVAENPRPALKPGREASETALLLNPFGQEDPADHLEFDRHGLIKAKDKSPHGQATIDTCGLDRASLVDCRLEKAKRAHFLAQQYDLAESIKERETILADFVGMGDESCIHAGMVRAIFKQEIELPWAEVEEWVS